MKKSTKAGDSNHPTHIGKDAEKMDQFIEILKLLVMFLEMLNH